MSSQEIENPTWQTWTKFGTVGKSRLEDYPLGSKVIAITGGYWVKVKRGWKWHNGSTFPTPGGDVDWNKMLIPLEVDQVWKHRKTNQYYVISQTDLSIQSLVGIWLSAVMYEKLVQTDFSFTIERGFVRSWGDFYQKFEFIGYKKHDR